MRDSSILAVPPRFRITASLLMAGALLVGSNSRACTPAPSALPDPVLDRNRVLDAYCRADLVFIGKVVDSLEYLPGRHEVRIQLRRKYRGQVRGTEYALTSGSSCGSALPRKGLYLIGSRRRADTAYVDLESNSSGWALRLPRDDYIEVLDSVSSDEEVCSDSAIQERKRQNQARRAHLELQRERELWKLVLEPTE